MLRDDFKAILLDLRKREGNELVNELERIFLTRVPKDVDELFSARKDHNFETIRRKSHFLSTTLLTLKFNQGLLLLEELEESLEKNQEATTLVLTDRFIDYLNGALIAIK